MSRMDIFEYFACHTVLPIDLEEVCDQAKEYDHIDEFRFLPAKLDSTYCLGFLRKYVVRNGDAIRRADIYYSTSIRDAANIRLVCCKEILHAMDDEEESARTRGAVSNLVEQIIIPDMSGIPASVMSDHIGVLHALMVLLPRDALDILRPQYAEGVLSVDAVAEMAVIPTYFARLALSDLWESVVESIR